MRGPKISDEYAFAINAIAEGSWRVRIAPYNATAPGNGGEEISDDFKLRRIRARPSSDEVKLGHAKGAATSWTQFITYLPFSLYENETFKKHIATLLLQDVDLHSEEEVNGLLRDLAKASKNWRAGAHHCGKKNSHAQPRKTTTLPKPCLARPTSSRRCIMQA